MNRFLKSQFEGPGGISALLAIAFPMFLSSMFDMLMMVIDRLYLSYVGTIHQAAAMGGGMVSWLVTAFFCGVVGYASALVAQYYGAGQKYNCTRVIRQALLIAFAAYPVVLLLHYGIACCNVFGAHAPEEAALESRYFWYMGFGSIVSMLRFAYGSFFTGIGKTTIILLANTAALFVNLVANWILIFGHFGFKPLGLDGAAIGTILSGIVTVAILAACYLRESRKPEWREKGMSKLVDTEKLYLLIRYGLPQGVEGILSMACFTFTISCFHAYGTEVAAATTVVFNWDGFSFHPILGLQAGVTTLVAQSMGRNAPDEAVRSARSGYKCAFLYTFCMVLCFVFLTKYLIAIYTPESTGLDYTNIRAIATPMLRLASLYLVTDGILLIASGTLRGAGDTFWTMILNFGLHIFMAGSVFIASRILKMTPAHTWIFFVIAGTGGSLAMYIRYRLGRWKSLRIIAKSPAEAAA